jgi:C4-dicarboxylate-specific signal transduction histidine kinase
MVRDHGSGVGPEGMRRLFKPFSKSAKDAAETAPGVGLGLALSRRLADRMSGSLEIDKKVRDGARFVLTLPVRS